MVKCAEAGRSFIAVATPVAESSVTIPALKYVIDCGRHKRHKKLACGKSEDLQVLETVWISKDNAQQRKGRAGRTDKGTCFRLYSKTLYDLFAIHEPTELERSYGEREHLVINQMARRLRDALRSMTPSDPLKNRQPLCIKLTAAQIREHLFSPVNYEDVGRARNNCVDRGTVILTGEEECLSQAGEFVSRIPKLSGNTGMFLYMAVICGRPLDGIIIAGAAHCRDMWRVPYGSWQSQDPNRYASDMRKVVDAKFKLDQGSMSEPLTVLNLLKKFLLARQEEWREYIGEHTKASIESTRRRVSKKTAKRYEIWDVEFKGFIQLLVNLSQKTYSCLPDDTCFQEEKAAIMGLLNLLGYTFDSDEWHLRNLTMAELGPVVISDVNKMVGTSSVFAMKALIGLGFANNCIVGSLEVTPTTTLAQAESRGQQHVNNLFDTFGLDPTDTYLVDPELARPEVALRRITGKSPRLSNKYKANGEEWTVVSFLNDDDGIAERPKDSLVSSVATTIDECKQFGVAAGMLEARRNKRGIRSSDDLLSTPSEVTDWWSPFKLKWEIANKSALCLTPALKEFIRDQSPLRIEVRLDKTHRVSVCANFPQDKPFEAETARLAVYAHCQVSDSPGIPTFQAYSTTVLEPGHVPFLIVGMNYAEDADTQIINARVLRNGGFLFGNVEVLLPDGCFEKRLVWENVCKFRKKLRSTLGVEVRRNLDDSCEEPVGGFKLHKGEAADIFNELVGTFEKESSYGPLRRIINPRDLGTMIDRAGVRLTALRDATEPFCALKPFSWMSV